MSRSLVGLALAAAVLLTTTRADAGGMNEAPEQGAQALGRGGAFVAKADDATAILHNVAGLAAQHGTKVLISANLQASSLSFQRAGRYSGDPQKDREPWAGRPYPLLEDSGSPSPLPMLAVVSDLGTERLGVGIGVFAPNANPGKRFGGIVGTAPSPGRYDTVSGGSSIVLLPTAGAAYAVTDDLRIGLAAHALFGRFDESQIVYQPKFADCRSEDPRCDGRGHLMADGIGFAASAGALFRATENVHLGLSVRTPGAIEAKGQTLVTRPNGTWMTPQPVDATLTVKMPWTARAGVRFVATEDGAELYDLELDATWEGWGSASPHVTIPELKKDADEDEGWHDSLGVHAGGAYNLRLGDAVLTLRAGAYYDGPSTDSAATRLDFDTLPKVGSTLGMGLRAGAMSVSVAYAATASIPRLVEDGAVMLKDTDDKPLGSINSGEYRGFSHTLAASVEVDLARLFGGGPKPAAAIGVPATEPAMGEPPAGDTLEETWKHTPRAPSRRPRAVSASAQ